MSFTAEGVVDRVETVGRWRHIYFQGEKAHISRPKALDYNRFSHAIPKKGDRVQLLLKTGSTWDFVEDIRILEAPKPPSEASVNVPTVKLSTEAGASKAPEVAAQLTLLPIEQLSGSLVGLERAGEDPEIEELAESAKAHGILQPVIAMLSPGTKSVYLVVAGNRRVKAAKKAGLTHVPAIIRPYSLEEAYEFSLIENIQRKDLSDYEKGRLLKLMLSKFPQRYPSHDALAKRIGKSKSWVTLHIGAHETAEDLKKDKAVTRVTKPEELPERALRELRKVPEEERPLVLRKVAETPLEGPHEKPLSARRIAEKSGITAEIDTGYVFTCPVCSQKLRIIHCKPSNKHKFAPEVAK